MDENVHDVLKKMGDAGLRGKTTSEVAYKILDIGMRSALARMGLILLHGMQIDPGFEGHLRFGLYNWESPCSSQRHGRLASSLATASFSAGKGVDL